MAWGMAGNSTKTLTACLSDRVETPNGPHEWARGFVGLATLLRLGTAAVLGSAGTVIVIETSAEIRQHGASRIRSDDVISVLSIMLTQYLSAAMASAQYRSLGGGEGFYGDIHGFQGVFAQAATLEDCRTELASTLEDWLLFRISRNLPLPTVQGLDLTIRETPPPNATLRAN